MKDYIVIASSPIAEDCAQVGSQDYQIRDMKECRVFRNQLIRVFGEEPDNAKLVIKTFRHDFGNYHKVCVLFEENDAEGIAYAFKLEGNTPEKWDEEARKELGLCT